MTRPEVSPSDISAGRPGSITERRHRGTRGSERLIIRLPSLLGEVTTKGVTDCTGGPAGHVIRAACHTPSAAPSVRQSVTLPPSGADQPAASDRCQSTLTAVFRLPLLLTATQTAAAGYGLPLTAEQTAGDGRPSIDDC